MASMPGFQYTPENLQRLEKVSKKPDNKKHLVTGPKGNSEFCFPKTLNVPQGEAEENTEVDGKQSTLTPVEPVTKCFIYLPTKK